MAVDLIYGISNYGKTRLNDRMTVAYLLARPRFRAIVVRPEGFRRSRLDEIRDRAAFFTTATDAIDYLTAHELRNVIVSIAEAQEVIGRGDRGDDRVRTLIKRGRHAGVHFIADTQRAADLDPTIQAQAERRIFSFCQTLKIDVDRVQYYAQRDVARLIPSLPPFAFFSVYHDRVFTLTDGA
jgi:hypothetical protein